MIGNPLKGKLKTKAAEMTELEDNIGFDKTKENESV